MDRCHNCGELIDISQWYPIETVIDENNEVELYQFCSDSCHESHLNETE